MSGRSLTVLGIVLLVFAVVFLIAAEIALVRWIRKFKRE